MPDPDRSRRIDKTDARAGSREGVVRWVLAISLGLTVIAFALLFLTGALSQDPVEGQQNVQRRIEAQRDMAEPEGGSNDLAEEGDLVAPTAEGRSDESDATTRDTATQAE